MITNPKTSEKAVLNSGKNWVKRWESRLFYFYTINLYGLKTTRRILMRKKYNKILSLKSIHKNNKLR